MDKSKKNSEIFLSLVKHNNITKFTIYFLLQFNFDSKLQISTL